MKSEDVHRLLMLLLVTSMFVNCQHCSFSKIFSTMRTRVDKGIREMFFLHMLHDIFSPLSLWWVNVFAKSAFMKSLTGYVNVLTKTPNKFFILVFSPVLRFGGSGIDLGCQLGFGLRFRLGI